MHKGFDEILVSLILTYLTAVVQLLMIDKNSDTVNTVNVFSLDDEKMKVLAKVISNKSSIKILNMLFHNEEKEMTANEIAQKTDMSLQLVKHYLEKMQQVDLVCVSRTGKNSKARDMNYYKISKPAIVITPSKITEKAKQSKLLIRSFSSISRFFGMGIASMLAGLSLVLVSVESSLLEPIKSWYSEFSLPITIQGTGIADSMDESFYLAKAKVDSVVSNPGAGSGTPYFDPYATAEVLSFTGADFVAVMVSIGVIGAVMSLPFFVMSYRHSKKTLKQCPPTSLR
ncbi:MAG: ArsR/SmtB family transcription factor [Nitrosopumilus sp.]|uniref:ArsR/SmtB family transcription factor n=1 Tax=Nitrosopumilus sp. TaxID=2024843 RepID=UPI00293153AF|nr:winged helix-turn-helix domain-containing protein [Nitrosopumilus sp.]